jgi:protein tyrosine/serine phosphatase
MTANNRFYMVCTLLVLLLAGGRALGQMPTVSNFGMVQQGTLYRGAQPTRAELESLAKFGIRTVIDLRDDRTVRWERAVVENTLHLHFVNVPLNGLKAPKDEQLEQVLAAIDAAPKPVFIHCKSGKDRTGLVVAAFRITHDHWTNQQAMQEARQYGINWLQFGMKSYIRHYKPRPLTPAPAVWLPVIPRLPHGRVLSSQL